MTLLTNFVKNLVLNNNSNTLYPATEWCKLEKESVLWRCQDVCCMRRSCQRNIVRCNYSFFVEQISNQSFARKKKLQLKPGLGLVTNQNWGIQFFFLLFALLLWHRLNETDLIKRQNICSNKGYSKSSYDTFYPDIYINE